MLYIEIIKVRDLDVLPNARYTQSHGKWAEKDRNFAVTLTIEPVFMRVTREGVKIMVVPFGVIYCYYQKNFRVYKAVGMSCLTTFFIESAQLVLKTGVVDIDDLIVNTLGSLTGIVVYVILQQISFKNQKFEIHELIDISATMLPPMFVAFIAEMFLGDGSLKLLPVHCVVLLCYGIFVYVFLIRDFTRKAKVYYLACYVGAFYLSRVLL